MTSSVAWLLDGKAAGWATSGPLPALVPGRTYSMYGWTKDYSSSAINVNFTVEQLRALKPGQVRYFDGIDENPPRDRYAVGTFEQFRKATCGISLPS